MDIILPIKLNITTEMLQAISEIDEFKGKWQATHQLEPDHLDNLRHIATIESVASSTRIEGVKLNDKQVEKFLAGLEQESFSTRDEQEVAGYADAMNMVFESYASITITENHIKQLHSMLLKYSTKDRDHLGEYKTVNNNVEAFDSKGASLGVIFQTATPFETPAMMKDLLEWSNELTFENKQHSLLIIAVFTVVFLAIHPFKDGNGRLSPILTSLLLLRAGYSYVPYSSMEAIIEANKKKYYLALRNTQTTILTKTPDWEAWIAFFLQTMIKQKNNLANKLGELKSVNAELPLLSRDVLAMTLHRGEISVREIEDFTGSNRNTIKAHLKKLVEHDYLVAVGKGRGARYKMKNQYFFLFNFINLHSNLPLMEACNIILMNYRRLPKPGMS